VECGAIEDRCALRCGGRIPPRGPMQRCDPSSDADGTSEQSSVPTAGAALCISHASRPWMSSSSSAQPTTHDFTFQTSTTSVCN
jgi:hypothetical protein